MRVSIGHLEPGWCSVLSRVEYRPLEGFVLAVSPFNFTAIGGNIPGGMSFCLSRGFRVNWWLLSVPALVGNVVVWKPAPAATYSNYLVYNILTEAGVPPGVIQFVPGGPELVQAAIKNPNFASLHFTGSTSVFKGLWKDIASNIDVYKGYPRIVGETGGKNWHIIHRSAEIKNAVLQSVRSAFEYQGGYLVFFRHCFCQPSPRTEVFCAVASLCLKIYLGEWI